MHHLVVTGGTGGLGSAIVEAFRDPCWEVAAPGRQGLDVTDGAAIAAFFAERPVDLLVCAAGVTGEQPLGRLPEARWDQVMAVNFTGAAACAHAALPGMLARGTGQVVFISSFSALHPPPGLAA